MSGLGYYVGLAHHAFNDAQSRNLPSPDLGRGEPNKVDVDLDGKTELMQAVSDAKLDIVTQLIQDGANVNDVDNNDKTALMYAAEIGSSVLAQPLIDAGANLDAQDVSGNTALLYAARICDTDVVGLLLERGADAGIINNSGDIALFVAERNNLNSSTYMGEIDTAQPANAVDLLMSDYMKHNSPDAKIETIDTNGQGAVDDAKIEPNSVPIPSVGHTWVM